MEYRPQKLLCVVAHPDDVEVTLGATVAKWAALGTEVSLLVCTDGGKGTSEADKAGREIAKTRAMEEARAAQILGISCWHQLNYADGELRVNDHLRSDIAECIRAHKPDAVFTMDPTFFYSVQWSYVNHRDHRAVGEATLDAVYPMARDAAALPELLDNGYEPHGVTTLLMSHFERENYMINVSDYFKIKEDALRAHESQFGDASGVIDFVNRRATEDGRVINVEKAEGFVKIEVF